MKRSKGLRALALLMSAMTVAVLTSPMAVAGGRGRIDGYRPARDLLLLTTASGSVKKIQTAPTPKVILRDSDGNKEVANENELADGAKVLGVGCPTPAGTEVRCCAVTARRPARAPRRAP
ncbi:MAG: hypothetical protein ACLGHL_00670, partial [Actinomycetota bacterium]